MENIDKRTSTTLNLGDGWKMTVTRVAYNTYPPNPILGRGAPEVSLQIWSGLARTGLDAVTVYEDASSRLALAEVIFEPTFVKDGNRWQLREPGRTGYAPCPGTGMNKENEQALLNLIPIEDVLANILTIALLELR